MGVCSAFRHMGERRASSSCVCFSLLPSAQNPPYASAAHSGAAHSDPLRCVPSSDCAGSHCELWEALLTYPKLLLGLPFPPGATAFPWHVRLWWELASGGAVGAQCGFGLLSPEVERFLTCFLATCASLERCPLRPFAVPTGLSC